MKRSILFYPYIKVPDLWLKQSLLYWDEVGSIIPSSVYLPEFDPRFAATVDFMEEREIFRKFNPMKIHSLGGNSIDQFRHDFIETFESPHFQNLLPRSFVMQNREQKFGEIKSKFHRRVDLSRNEPIRGARYSQIHDEKFNYTVGREIMDYLIDLGLVIQSEQAYWLMVEEYTSFLYMSLLAKHLANSDDKATVTGTLNTRFESMIFQAKQESHSVKCASVLFKNLLPVPRADASIEDIIYFREARRQELLHFRGFISNFQNEISNAEDQAELNVRIATFGETLEREVNDLKRMFNESKLNLAMSTVKSLVNLRSPTLLGIGAVLANQATKIADVPIEWSLSGVGIVGAVEIGSFLMNRHQRQRDMLRESPFSYVYLAEESGLINAA